MSIASLGSQTVLRRFSQTAHRKPAALGTTRWNRSRRFADRTRITRSTRRSIAPGCDGIARVGVKAWSAWSFGSLVPSSIAFRPPATSTVPVTWTTKPARPAKPNESTGRPFSAGSHFRETSDFGQGHFDHRAHAVTQNGRHVRQLGPREV